MSLVLTSDQLIRQLLQDKLHGTLQWISEGLVLLIYLLELIGMAHEEVILNIVS